MGKVSTFGMLSINITSLFIVVVLFFVPLLFYSLRNTTIPSVPNATPHLPLLGNSISYGINPVKFLLEQRARHGNIFLVDLVAIRIVFFLGPRGTNAILKGTDSSGISFWAAMEFVIGEPIKKGFFRFYLFNERMGCRRLGRKVYSCYAKNTCVSRTFRVLETTCETDCEGSIYRVVGMCRSNPDIPMHLRSNNEGGD